MNAPANRMGTEWLALTGVGIGLVVALIVDRQLLDSTTDRPLIAAALTGAVALVWIAVMRVVVWPTSTLVSKRKTP